MKFTSATLALSLVLGSLSSSAAFVTPSLATTSAATATSLPMVATNEIVEGTKPKKTREERLQLASKGLQVHMVGLSIHHASVEVREKLAIAEANWNDASNEICDMGVVEEAAVLSTCNRFEVYYAAADPREAMASVTQYLSQRSGLPVSVLRSNLFMLSGAMPCGTLCECLVDWIP